MYCCLFELQLGFAGRTELSTGSLTWVCLTKRGSPEREAPEIDVLFGTLDRESLEMDGVRPTNHAYWGFGIDWVKELIVQGDPTFDAEMHE